MTSLMKTNVKDKKTINSNMASGFFSTKENILFHLFVFFFVLIDQISKALVLRHLEEPYHFFSGFSMTLVYNKGIAFGIHIPKGILLFLSIFIIILIYFFLLNKFDLKKKSVAFLMAAFFGGAIGNILDRLFRGTVIDFISIGNFPVFNFADSFITVSIFLIVLFYGKIIKKEKKV